MTRWPKVGLAVLFLLGPWGAGCSKEKLNELVDKTKQKVSEGADKVQQSVQSGMASATGAAKEQLSLAGNAELQLDAPLAMSACYASLFQLGEGQPNVLQLRSYRDGNQESFPSFLLQGQVSAGGASALVGQVIQARLFVQKDAQATVWYSPTGTHVELRVVSTDDKTLVAEVTGSVRNTDSGADQQVTGKFSAVW